MRHESEMELLRTRRLSNSHARSCRRQDSPTSRLAPACIDLVACRSVVGTGCKHRGMATEDRSFVAWGFVAGAALPPGLRLDGSAGWFEVMYELPDSFQRLKPPGVAEIKVAGSHFFATSTQRQPRVGSKAGFRLSVEAPDADVAFRKARDEILPVYLAGLAAIDENPLYGAVVAVHEQGHDQQWCSRMSTASALAWNPRILQTTDVEEQGPSLVWAAQHDATGRVAAMEFQTANMYLAGKTDSAAETQAILSTYYFVIERIVNRLNKDRPLSVDPEAQRQRIEELQEELETAISVDEQVAAVLRARDELMGLRRRGLRRGVREAGMALRVADAMVVEAVKFTDLRNARLGHPAPLGDHSRELDEWLMRAQACAMAYLAAYLRWVDERGFAHA